MGSPTVRQSCADRPALRRRGPGQVVLLQRNRRRVWPAVHPAATTGRTVPSAALRAAAEVAEALHDTGGGVLRRADLRVLADARPHRELREGAGEHGCLLRVGDTELPARERTAIPSAPGWN